MSASPPDDLFPLAFRIVTPFGPSVGVALDAAPGEPGLVLPRLHPAEREIARELRGARLVEFAGGRIAARLALGGLAAGDRPVLRGPDGAPRCAGTSISISHSRRLAVALVGTVPGPGVGVDIEPLAVERGDALLAERIVSAVEHAGDDAGHPLAVVERLALKEAAWKALHPLVGPVRLRDLVAVRTPGGVAVSAPGVGAGVTLSAVLLTVDGHALAAVAAVNADSG